MDEQSQRPEYAEDHTVHDRKTKISNQGEIPESVGKSDIQLATLPEILSDLHNRYEHLIFLGKRNNITEKHDSSQGFCFMSVGDIHTLLGLLKETEDSLMDMLRDRRYYVDEVEIDGEDDLDENIA